ncbi:uncharacterized protein LOC131049621 [Cryptomeria japonica]|uniref:uncharacterized protein LOC131049621 n=1 Tax=Cryptomeria japonica TaxID=3369 RepID=UPI0027DA40AB|nr:uncharacterized protein LOC131049621 [Cryptomeria japonica]
MAWGITIHKSQGLTLDLATADIDQTEKQGLTFTTLSRVKAIEHLRIQPDFSYQRYSQLKGATSTILRKAEEARLQELSHSTEQAYLQNKQNQREEEVAGGGGGGGGPGGGGEPGWSSASGGGDFRPGGGYRQRWPELSGGAGGPAGATDGSQRRRLEGPTGAMGAASRGRRAPGRGRQGLGWSTAGPT